MELLIFGVAFIALIIGVVKAFSAPGRVERPGMCPPGVCIPDRSNTITGAYSSGYGYTEARGRTAETPEPCTEWESPARLTRINEQPHTRQPERHMTDWQVGRERDRARARGAEAETRRERAAREQAEANARRAAEAAVTAQRRAEDADYQLDRARRELADAQARYTRGTAAHSRAAAEAVQRAANAEARAEETARKAAAVVQREQDRANAYLEQLRQFADVSSEFQALDRAINARNGYSSRDAYVRRGRNDP
jgi:hypothetical protein